MERKTEMWGGTPDRIQKALLLLESVEKLEAWQRIDICVRQLSADLRPDGTIVGAVNDGPNVIVLVESSETYPDCFIKLSEGLGGK